MQQMWPMLMMGMQYQQRAGETAAGRAHSAEEARKSRLFQAQQAQQRETWAQDRQDETLAQRAREYAGGLIDATTGPDDMAYIVKETQRQFPGAAIGTPSMWPESKRIQAGVEQVGGAGGGEAADPGYLASIASKYHLGPLQETVGPQHGPIRPPEVTQDLGRPPDALLFHPPDPKARETWETPAGTALENALAGRQQALTKQSEFDAREAGLRAASVAEAQLPTAMAQLEQQAVLNQESALFQAELNEIARNATPETLEIKGMGDPNRKGYFLVTPEGLKYQELDAFWTGIISALPGTEQGFPIYLNTLEIADPEAISLYSTYLTTIAEAREQMGPNPFAASQPTPPDNRIVTQNRDIRNSLDAVRPRGVARKPLPYTAPPLFSPRDRHRRVEP
jgi:hypothetical protein